MDAFYLGDAIRAVNVNPTLKLIEKLGGSKRKGEFTGCREIPGLVFVVVNQPKRIRQQKWQYGSCENEP